LIVAAALVFVLAIWFGRRLRVSLKRGDDSVSVELGGQLQENSAGVPTINVGEGLIIENSKTGDIAGVESEQSGGALAGKQPIKLAQGARVTGSEVGDIVAIKQEASKSGKRK
jgi:uncharacterized protein YuzE